MQEKPEFQFDTIGTWSEIKLAIIREYAAAYSKILTARRNPAFHHVYIDGFAGAGVHISKSTGQFVAGSPTNALLIDPPFREYHLIDLDGGRIGSLQSITEGRRDVHLYKGDASKILLDSVLPRVDYARYRRALLILDPYGLHLDWRVIQTAGAMRSVEIFLNFPVADMNRNVLWRRRDDVSPEQEQRLTRFWGDASWKDAAYRPSKQASLWGGRGEEKVENQVVSEAFRQRLQDVAGFDHVPPPMAMTNSNGAVVYYLYFASHKPVGEGIVRDIFAKHGHRGDA